MFCQTEQTHEDIKLAAAEGVLVKHNHSFCSMDCKSKLVKKLFDQKFSSARTKTEAIVFNVLATLAINEMKGQMEQAKLITAALDTSNHNAVKLVLILAQYFSPSLEMETKILDFQSIKGETSDILQNILCQQCKHIICS